MMVNDGRGKRYLGKYRGKVVDNIDPLGRGRLSVNVPGVHGDKEAKWAEACVPLAGPTGTPMGVFLVPPKETAVWVEFENGESDRPIWVGCIWGGTDRTGLPPAAHEGVPTSPNIVLMTGSKNSLTLSGAPGDGITIRAASGASIAITASGIKVDNGRGATIELTGAKVSINGTALEVE